MRNFVYSCSLSSRVGPLSSGRTRSPVEPIKLEKAIAIRRVASGRYYMAIYCPSIKMDIRISKVFIVLHLACSADKVRIA